MRGEPDPSLSARVRLEVAFLDDSDVRPASQASDDGRPRLTVLVVAAEADVRRYVGECLRGRADLRICEASTPREAADLASAAPPDFAIVDATDGLEGLAHLRTILIVDEVPYGSATVLPRVRLLSRPFSAEQLIREVDGLLGDS